jgi:hypothetical protein
MQKTVSTKALFAALGHARTRADRWISDGDFTPVNKPEAGKTRVWTEQDAARIECLFRLVDSGVNVKVGRAISHLFTHWNTSTFLVVQAHERNVVHREKNKHGGWTQVDEGHHFIGHIVRREELMEHVQPPQEYGVRATFIIDLDDVRDDIDRAFKLAIRLDDGEEAK